MTSLTTRAGAPGSPSGEPVPSFSGRAPFRAWWIVPGVVVALVLFAIGALLPRDISGRRSQTTAGDYAAQAFAAFDRARNEADPAYLAVAERSIETSFELQPEGNFAASLAMATLMNSRHEFSSSVDWAKRAIAINPHNAAPYGLLGDARYELGRIRASDAAYQQMIDRRPDVAAYVRASYSAQTHGNYDVALNALNLALEAAPPVGEEAAWLYHQFGDVYATLGRYERSESVNRRGSRLAPGYVPPTVGIAESYIARGRYEDALPIMERAVEELPALEYLVTLGDLYWVLGDRDQALVKYGSAADRFALHRRNGVLPDHDFVQFYVDHGYRREAALHDARYIYDNRSTPAAADTLAWALHAVGRDDAAWRYVTGAIEHTIIPDAMQHFHAAVIADALGRDGVARAFARRSLKLDPRFSLFHLDTAERLAR